MTKFTPESGYPSSNPLDPNSSEFFDPEASFSFTDGSGCTGADLNERLKQWFANNPRGQQLAAYLRGEAPEPEPLYSLVEYDDGSRSTLLGRGEVDVTDLETEPEVAVMNKELFDQ